MKYANAAREIIWKLLSISKRTKSSVTAPPKTETMKVLNVAEKNDAAKRIAEMLSNGNSSRVRNYLCVKKILKCFIKFTKPQI